MNFKICPNCSREYELNHRQRIYCSVKCKNDFNNRKRLKCMIKEIKSEDNEEMLHILYYDFGLEEASLQELKSCDIDITCYSWRENDSLNNQGYTLHFGGMALRRINHEEFSIHSHYDL